jgi:hypothetical protein
LIASRSRQAMMSVASGERKRAGSRMYLTLGMGGSGEFFGRSSV